MPYTLWSKGRLVGHTDLGFRESMPGMRCGWFQPTAAGEQIVEVITSPSRVLLHAAQRGDRTSLEVDLALTGRSVEALELELRAEDGSVVKTEDIGITDSEVTLQYADLAETVEVADGTSLEELFSTDVAEDFELLEFAVEVDDETEELEPLPRYQILVFLEGHEELMSREAVEYAP